MLVIDERGRKFFIKGLATIHLYLKSAERLMPCLHKVRKKHNLNNEFIDSSTDCNQ